MTINRFSELATIAVRALSSAILLHHHANVATHKSFGREFYVMGRRAYTMIMTEFKYSGRSDRFVPLTRFTRPRPRADLLDEASRHERSDVDATVYPFSGNLRTQVRANITGRKPKRA